MTSSRIGIPKETKLTPTTIRYVFNIKGHFLILGFGEIWSNNIFWFFFLFFFFKKKGVK
jgi:hypothetical protein